MAGETLDLKRSSSVDLAKTCACLFTVLTRVPPAQLDGRFSVLDLVADGTQIYGFGVPNVLVNHVSQTL